MKKNIFVVGLDDHNRKELRSIRNADAYEFHDLLDLQTVKRTENFPVEKWLSSMEERLESFRGKGSVDAIIGFWDFPVSLMVPALCRRFHLPGPSMESVMRCEHKYWSRREQRQVVPEHIPAFAAVNPFGGKSHLDDIPLDYPFWLKPIKAFGSQLGFKIHNRQELDEAIETTKARIGRFAVPFNFFLKMVDLPGEIEDIDGFWCIAEEIITGRQCTVEGYIHKDEIHSHGTIDSLYYPNSHSFFRYQYPSTMPEEVLEQMRGIAAATIEHMGLDHSSFNIEFLYDEKQEAIRLLEVNSRISQSHSDIFRKVDGASNHQVVVDLAENKEPDFPHGEGEFGCAAKFHLRHFEDGVVTNAPGDEDIIRLRQEIPHTEVIVEAHQGQRLSEMQGQDSYSYRLAVIYMGADDEDQLLAKYEKCVELLGFEVTPIKEEKAK